MTSGRPSLKLDKQRLRGLRKEKGLTQLALSQLISEHSPTWGRGASDKTLTTDYQRIEREGKTSQKTAEAIAKALDVSLELLEGKGMPDSATYLKHIMLLIREQIAKGNNPALMSDLAALNASSQEEGIEWLAEDISERIESIQLGRNPTEIAELVAHTGISESELLKPAHLEGYWFITISRRGWAEPAILHGADQIRTFIRDLINEIPFASFSSDQAIRIWRDGIWYRLEISGGLRKHTMRIDFVRCQPDEKGLRWVGQSWRDEYLIDPQLIYLANKTFNFVTAFEAPTSPQNVDQLRLKITEYSGIDYKSTGEEIIKGNLDELHPQTKRSFALKGNSHSLITSQLLAGLRKSLMPKSKIHPIEYWRVTGEGSIDICLEPLRVDLKALPGIRYQITLVEELSSGKDVPAPWRQADIEKAKETIRSWLIPTAN